MKELNKQILEAINRGINLALDSFEAQDDIQQQTHGKIINNYHTKLYLDLMNYVVDLGLPSGTLWCKYNLDVNPYEIKYSDNARDWYGYFYQWGDIKPENLCASWDNYKWSQNGHSDYLMKYCTDIDYGGDNDGFWFKDDLTQLLPEDDAVVQNFHLHNFKFHMPTVQDFEELLEYTTGGIVYDYKNIKNLDGWLLKSKNNNEELFIPASGYIGRKGHNKDINDGYLWSSSLLTGKPNNAYSLSFASDINITRDSRYLAYPIRGIIKL